MRSQTILLLATAISGVIAMGAYLAPSRKEIALMHMNDSDFSGALKHYAALQSQGDHSINVLVPLISLHVHYGEIDQAIALLQSFLRENPSSVEGYRRIAALYKASQRLYSYCESLEALQVLAPAIATLRELADTYDFLGQYEKESQALARLVASRGYRPREQDYVKLTSFYRASGRPAEASQTMLDLLAARQYDISADAMYLAAQVLLDNGEERQAFSAASGYLRQHERERDAIMLASRFREQGRFDSAYALLAPFLSNMDHSPELLQQVVTLQMARDKQKEAYDLLSRQFSKGVLPDSLTVTLIDLSIQYNDYALVDGLIHTKALEDIPEDALLRYAGLAFQQSRPELARAMQSRLKSDYLREAPLLAAVLDVVAQDTPQAMAALLALPMDLMPFPEQKLIVANICLRHGQTARAFTLLDGIAVTDSFNVLDAQQFAELYLETGQADKGMERLAAARRDSLPSVQTKMDKALLLLASGEGKMETVQQWLQDHPHSDSQLLADACDLASRHHRNTIALIFAQRLYRIDPKPQNRLHLAEILLDDHRYAEAMRYLQVPSEHDKNARAMYLEAMAAWIRQAGASGMPDAQRTTLGAFISAALKHADMSMEERRNLAYLLHETGFADKAEGIFLALAGIQPFGNPDVNELLAFWGEHLSPGALAWVESRARNADGAEKAAWLTHLNNTGHPQSVLAILQGVKDLPQSVIDAYIDALVATHNRQLGNILMQEIAHASDPVRLVHLATLARQEDLQGAAEKGWRKLHKLDPGNAEATKELGLLAFAANRYTEAEQLLKEYLQNNQQDSQNDYRVNYVYAEILQHKAKKDEAKPYFARAQQQVSEIRAKDMTSSLDEAHLLYRNNRLKEAVDLYRKLLAQHPENKTVRADFAELLIETRQYDEASLILQ